MGFRVAVAALLFSFLALVQAVPLEEQTFQWPQVAAAASGSVAIIVCFVGLSKLVHEFVLRDYFSEPEAMRSLDAGVNGRGENTKL